MTFYRSISAVLVPVCWVLLSVAEDVNITDSAAAPRLAVTNSSVVNSSVVNSSVVNPTNSSGKDIIDGLNVYSSMIQRALYVLIGITLIGVLYFLIRAVRLKRPIYRKKYGLLSNYDDAVEMEAVESDEDDTLYEARSLRR